jgi:NTE family protein
LNGKIKDKNKGVLSLRNSNPDDTQRALVLQGGGALGAYEVGAIKSLYKILSKEDNRNHRPGRPLFDIIAGTSIGAINASILVSNVVVKKKSWLDSIKELESFWTDIKKGVAADPKDLDIIKRLPWYIPWQRQNESEGKILPKDERIWLRNKILPTATEEAARRHYSVKYLSLIGMTKKVFSAPILRPDYKFLDPDEKWYFFSNEGLKKTIKQHAKFPIPARGAANKKKIPPRLLVTSVDIAEGITVVFDSFKKSDGLRKTGYRKAEGETGYKHIIEYSGITLDHVMASGALPQLYPPQTIGKRKFWDGGLLSNTPFRELLDSYHDYWIDKVVKKEKDKIPNLEVYIVNVHPSKGDINPTIYDEVKNRENNIVYGDRSSEYDQRVAMVMGDYVDIINELKDLVLKHLKTEDEKKAFREEFEDSFKMKEARRSTAISGKKKNYGDLIMGIFELTKVVRIERNDDENSVSDKIADFTLETIKALIKLGETDTLSVLGSKNNKSLSKAH